MGKFTKVDKSGRRYKEYRGKQRTYLDEHKGRPVPSWWTDIHSLGQTISKERVGYPTQKPEALVERIIRASSNPGDVVLDVFCGGGGTGVVAQQLGRSWIMVDQSRVAVAVTAERLKNDATTREFGDDPLPDFTVEHWGVYEADKLSLMPAQDFRQFVLHCYDARISSEDAGIHGYKGSGARIPVWVGSPNRRDRATAHDVNEFAEAITQLERYQGDEGLRDGTMLAWGFARDARDAAELLRQRDGLEIGLVRLNQVQLDSPEFRSHVSSKSTDRGDYSEFLTFVQPPLVEISHKKLRGATYEFSAGGSQVFNAGASLINVQWDFNHRDGRFEAAPDTWFGKREKAKNGKKAGPPLTAQHTFPYKGTFTVACKVQDDKGGEGMATITIEVD
ncbi:MAG: DNA methyltransferase [Chloroflexi bacterium]|nr:DNA methyltransferase [Chloroflexota bacterium]